MLQLEHLNLVVTDIEKTLRFYQAALPHWKVRGGGDGLWYGKPRQWVHFGDDYQYLTFNDDGDQEIRDLSGHQVGLAHFAFVTTDLDGVIQRLAEAGFEVDKAGAEDPFRRNVYFIDPDGYEIEFVQYLSDIPTERNQYA
ncbi:VOC family protein [Pseudomaricurvus alkylphenolicus]|jgi:catechol 2,3-dioxygenase-like lactoylglutathione lyase family enzyme|uniref:VOC family protein n=1 Tax=Pseudomaricurvus alkylphenolicus TaxID=1306991 RepID=UPI00141E8C17|nr:VOC family protein [Pseudomaricurvus alkylphenolicus]NIB41931.1 VOC family protein [Pseudomaricurvus alkylphenolicus]